MGTKTILIIEDDLEICEFYRVLLEREGYVIYEAHTGPEALAKLGLDTSDNRKNDCAESTIPDLIILDVMLPEIDGYTLLLHFLEYDALKNIPVVVITAKSSMSDLFTSKPNVKCFFPKPFDHKLIKEKIKEIFGY